MMKPMHHLQILTTGPQSPRSAATNERVGDKVDGCLLKPLSADPLGRLFEIRTLLYVATEHRLRHAETLAYMFHETSAQEPRPIGSMRPSA